VKLIGFILILTLGLSSAAAQTTEPKLEQTDKAAEEQTAPEIWLHLAGGKKFQAEEVNQDNDGYWYKRGNIWTFVDRARVASVERISPEKEADASEPLRGHGRWKIADAGRVEAFFAAKFGRPLPMGAFGQSALHTQWGLDHRNGMDVSLHPDSVEGRVLIAYLRSEGIPFLAFRGPIPRVATGPHIHIGNPSPRVRLQHHSR